MTDMRKPFRVAPAHVAEFRARGFFVTPVLFAAAALATLRAAVVQRYEAAVREAARTSPEQAARVRTRAFLAHNHQHGAVFDAFARRAPFAALARALVGPDVDIVWSQAIVKPGHTGRELAWHQDGQYAITEPLDPGFTALVAITDSTIANGTVWALPGRHREGLLPHVRNADGDWVGQYDDAGKVPVEMQAGQALIFSRFLPHYSGPNTTDAMRITYQLGYCPPGIRLAATGAPFGDQLPFLRGGRPVERPGQ